LIVSSLFLSGLLKTTNQPDEHSPQGRRISRV
jgi:hypothetical protein